MYQEAGSELSLLEQSSARVTRCLVSSSQVSTGPAGVRERTWLMDLVDPTWEVYGAELCRM